MALSLFRRRSNPIVLSPSRKLFSFISSRARRYVIVYMFGFHPFSRVLQCSSFRGYLPPRLSVRWGYDRSVVLDQHFRGRMSQFHLQPCFILFGHKVVGRNECLRQLWGHARISASSLARSSASRYPTLQTLPLL